MANNVVPLSMARTPSKPQSAADLICRLDRFDNTVTDDECMAVVEVLDADSAPAGLEYATNSARAIMRCYPRSDVDDPAAYALAMAAVMSEYPRGVLDRLTDPRTGVARFIKFIPRVAEIADACDAEMERRKKLRSAAGMVMWRRARKSDADMATYRPIMERVGIRKAA